MNMITIGADPELFLFNPETNKPVSAVGRMPGDKENPFQIPELPPGFCVQVDNCSVEYNIPPALNASEFVDSNCAILKWLNDFFSKQGLVLRPVPSVKFLASELNDPRAWIFGCDPDFNAWKLETNPRPRAKNKFLRSAGGHLHFGFGDRKLSNYEKIQCVRLLDLKLGGWLAQNEPKNERKQLYGQPGAMRFKSYGFEWRAPSNFWLSDLSLMRTVYNEAYRIVNNVLDGMVGNELNNVSFEEICDIFDNVKKCPPFVRNEYNRLTRNNNYVLLSAKNSYKLPYRKEQEVQNMNFVAAPAGVHYA